MFTPRYDIFISYRRDKGLAFARCICYYLRSKGVKCFFDLQEIKGGKFDETIYDAVKRSKYFLLLLTDNSLDRCVDAEDWVRLEIEHALLKKDVRRDIVPVTIRGRDFDFPDTLPGSMADLKTIQCETVDFEGRFERDIDYILVNRMKRLRRRINKQTGRQIAQRKEKAENAFCERARRLKEEDRIRIDVGRGNVILLEFADQLDIDRQTAGVLIEEVNRSVARKKKRNAFVHAIVPVLITLIFLLAVCFAVYWMMPFRWRAKVDERWIDPFCKTVRSWVSFGAAGSE